MRAGGPSNLNLPKLPAEKDSIPKIYSRSLDALDLATASSSKLATADDKAAMKAVIAKFGLI